MRQQVEGVDFAVDEHIWGHRLYDEQLPHLTVLEFLGVLGSNADNPLQASATDRVRYRPQRQIRLRGLLFNNPYVEAVRELKQRKNGVTLVFPPLTDKGIVQFKADWQKAREAAAAKA